MSRVYFHSPSGEAELWGGERAWLGGLCSDLAIGVMDVFNHAERFAVLMGEQVPEPGEHRSWVSHVELNIRVGLRECLSWKGKPVESFALVLNTALRAGNDPVKLAARIHGQCEVHAWCDGPNRAWLAGIIAEGLASDVFRKNTGYAGREHSWEHVTAFLLARDDEPVVLSYSVCDSFPNPEIAGVLPEDPEDEDGIWTAWEKLSGQEQWDRAFAALTANNGGPELKPEGWADFAFMHGLSAFDLLAPDWEQRLGAAMLDGDEEEEGS